MTNEEIDNLSRHLDSDYKSWLKKVHAKDWRPAPRLDPLLAALLGRQHAAEINSEIISSMRAAGSSDMFVFLNMWTHRRDELVSQFWTDEVAREMQESGIAFGRSDIVWTLSSVAFLIQYFWLPAQERQA